MSGLATVIPIAHEAKAKGLQIQDQSGLQTMFKAILSSHLSEMLNYLFSSVLKHHGQGYLQKEEFV